MNANNQSKPRYTPYTDQLISDRHRNMFGKHLPLVNFDFIGMHYDNAEVTDFVEFKHCNIQEIDLAGSNYRAIQKAADKLGVPFFIIIYDPDNWSYYLIQFNLNPAVKRCVKHATAITEKNLILGLYGIRGRKCPADVLVDLSEATFDPKKIPVIKNL